MQKTLTHRPSRTTITLMALASTMPVTISLTNARETNNSYSDLAQREMIRRQNAIAEGDRLLAEGRQAYAQGDYQQAVDKYTQALSKVPDAPLYADRRLSIIAHKSDASVALVMQHRKVGKYTEARALLEGVLAVDPNNAAAKRELGYLDDPIRTNPALTFEHTQNIDKVRRALYIAEGNYNLGKYDDAKRDYEKVLRTDQHNSAARRGLERIAQAKSDYYRAAYDHTRAELLSQVDAAWELSVPISDINIPTDTGQIKDNIGGVAYITEKLRRIIIPKIDFDDTTVEEAIDFLRMRAAELDTLELDPARKGVNFVVRRPRAPGVTGADTAVDPAVPATDAAVPVSDPGSLRVKELRIRNVPLAVALKYICDQVKLRYKVDDFAVTLVPQTESGEDIFTRSFPVPPDFISSLSSGDDGGGAPAAADPFATTSSGGTKKLAARKPILELLKNAGINFPEGTSATLSANGMLLVTNTPTELDKVEQLVDSASKSARQVKITTKFVEITQENNDELGFDWIVTPFGLSNNIFAAGGTRGNQPGRTGGDFISPVDGTNVAGVPVVGERAVNSNIVTSGLRSGDQAVNRNSIDAILNNPNRASQRNSVAPGIMALTGLFSDGQVQMIMRGLAQKKGTDLMTAPSVTARSGQKATIEIIREFIYPTEYEPPQIPQQFGGGIQGGIGGGIGGGIAGGNQGGGFPVTPSTPTAFETRNTGVTLEIEPTIGVNDFVIDLRFVPEIVEFEGFVNYGSPIQSTSTDALGNPVTNTLTENRIEMPVFSTRRVNTALTIYDGYTVAVGGLMREDVQKVEDRVPILGDIPIIGRLFQTSSENRIKSNLIVFVTAQIIDATGRPLRGAEAESAVPVPTGGSSDPGAGVLPPLDLPTP